MSQESIANVLGLYAIALDSHSWDLFDEIFTPDIEVIHPGDLHWRGLESFKGDFIKAHENIAGHHHFLGYPQILIEGDRAFALTHGRFSFLRVSPAADPLYMMEGDVWYDDELVRLSGQWRVRKRVVGKFWGRGEEGDVPHVVDSFPEWVSTGRVGYVNALRRHLRQGEPASGG